MSSKDNVYQGKTAEQLADSYNVFKTIPDPEGWLQTNRERAQALENSLKPIKDISYGDAPIQKLDIYKPENAVQAPVLIDIHGGGWTHGSKNPRAIQAEAVTSLGALWVPIDYGLAPPTSIEQMIDHVRRALGWIYRNIATYGGAPDRLFIFGNSAGAHLAATALMPGWTRGYDLPDNILKGAVLTSGIFDMESQFHMGVGPQAALNMSLEEARQASPLHHPPSRPLPVIVAYGESELEGFEVESKNYVECLKNMGCPVTFFTVPKANHFDMINELAHTEGQLFQETRTLITPT